MLEDPWRLTGGALLAGGFSERQFIEALARLADAPDPDPFRQLVALFARETDGALALMAGGT